MDCKISLNQALNSVLISSTDSTLPTLLISPFTASDPAHHGELQDATRRLPRDNDAGVRRAES
jgi:hypothetical protein